MKRSVLVLLVTFLAAAFSGRTHQKPDPKRDSGATAISKTEGFREIKVYYKESWESGELKDCSTLPEEASLLICDGNGWWVDIEVACVGDGGSRDECRKKAIAAVRDKTKLFLVKFSAEPWPKEQKNNKASWWKCAKDGRISCSAEEMPK
jgi:hypothetical protein